MRRRSTFGWLDLLRGILFIVLGIVTLCAPQLALSGLVVLFGVIAMVSGISDIVLYTKLRKYTAFESTASLITGIISALAGLLLCLNPLIGRWILNFIFPMWFIVHCISRIASYGFMKEVAGRSLSMLMVCLNVLGLLFGILMIFNPMLFTMSFGTLIAINIIILGVSSIVEAFSNVGASDASWYTLR